MRAPVSFSPRFTTFYNIPAVACELFSLRPVRNNMHYCLECERLAIDCEQATSEHADYVAEYEAALQAHDSDRIWELKLAVRGSAEFCRKAIDRLAAHRADMHNVA